MADFFSGSASNSRKVTRCGDTERVLSLASLGVGLLATLVLSVSIGVDYWLHTIEPYEFKEEDSSPDKSDGAQLENVEVTVDNEQYQAASNNPIFIISSNSGLWRFCIYMYSKMDLPTPVEEYEEEEIEDVVNRPPCMMISYFGQGFEKIDESETTTAILRGIRKATPAIVLSVLVMASAQIVGILGYIRRDFRTVVAAVLFIISALSLALGEIFYISAVNDEVSQWKPPENATDGETFSYRYGWAFFAAGSTFILVMISAVGHVTVYLRRYVSSDVRRMLVIVPGLDIKLASANEAEEPVDSLPEDMSRPVGLQRSTRKSGQLLADGEVNHYSLQSDIF